MYAGYLTSPFGPSRSAWHVEARAITEFWCLWFPSCPSRVCGGVSLYTSVLSIVSPRAVPFPPTCVCFKTFVPFLSLRSRVLNTTMEVPPTVFLDGALGGGGVTANVGQPQPQPRQPLIPLPLQVGECRVRQGGEHTLWAFRPRLCPCTQLCVRILGDGCTTLTQAGSALSRDK